MKKLIVYTDGAARGNPGPGGFGAVLIWGNSRKELKQGFRKTTNNRMELMAVIAALETLTRSGLHIEIYTDSKYVCEAVEKKWVWDWKRKGWKGKKNIDLWKKFISLFELHTISFYWVKGHNGNIENERCDRLATDAADNGPHFIDAGYESQNEDNASLL